MTPEEWASVEQYLLPYEFADSNSGVNTLDAETEMKFEIVWPLYCFRNHTQRRIYIHSALARHGHSSTSAHYEGMAVDFSIEGVRTIADLFEAWIELERWGGLFLNIGIYPYWRRPGFHVDNRPSSAGLNARGKRWGRNPEGVYVVLSLDFWRDALRTVSS